MAMQLDNKGFSFSIACKKYWDQQGINEDVQEIGVFVKNKKEIELLIENDNIFSVFEYQNFNLFFQAQEKETKLIITGLTKNDIILKPNTDQTFFNQDGHITPGIYPLIIQYKGEEYYSVLEILPKNMTVEELGNLKRIIDKLGQGLIYNLKYAKVKSLKNDFFKTDLYLLDFLEKDLMLILRTANNILKSPIQSLEKNYQERSDRQVIDNKSIRWLMRGKGQSLNPAIDKISVLYQKKAKKSYTNQENKWFLKSIDYISSKVRSLKNKLSIELYNEKEKLINKKLKKEELINKLKEIGDAPQFENQAKSIFGRVKSLEDDIERIKENKIVLRKDLIRTENLLDKFAYILNSEIYMANKNFNKVSHPSPYIFKDQRYRKIHNLYEKLTFFHKEEGGFLNIYQFKKTYKLYEYYVLINTIIILQDFGYKWTKGWIMEQDNRFLVSDIGEGEKLFFSKGDYQIKLSYEDEIIPIAENDLRQKRDFFFTLNRNLTPDLRLDIYQDDFLEKSIVIEVKYRQFQSIYNQEFNTDVMTQLSKYRNLEYIDCNGKLKRPVSKVIVVYPKDKHISKITQKKFFGHFIYNQLSPQDSDNQYGYEEYKQILQQLLLN